MGSSPMRGSYFKFKTNPNTIRKTMNAAILTIGEEILIGQIVDTNSAWIATQLNAFGVKVSRIVSISDTLEEIKSAIHDLFTKYDIVLVTGGLGPTNDDITKLAICEYFGAKLVLHKPTLEHITHIFSQRGLPLTTLNAKQAEVPDNCKVLHNPNGTAPGMLFENNGKLLVSMPGVPFEMEAIMELHVLPAIHKLSQGKVVYHKTVQTFGLPESFLAEKIAQWENQLPSSISLAYLPSPNSIRLRLSTIGDSLGSIEQEIQCQIDKLQQIIPENIFGFDNDTMATVVAKLLLANQFKLAIAESCTGGLISHLITQNPGSSAYFLGGVVAYDNSIKISELGVSEDKIQRHGAASQQVVEAMALGAKKRFNAHYAIATSGIAGPTGETPGKPVGTVWVAIATPQGIVSQRFVFGNDRQRNILRSAITALNLLRLTLLDEKKGKKY
ncbi:MAG TPA: competence/damage-inducible protein A [Bacteroidetes bacterium]|nr:competence/damage-inducible protein A [Bacteroidota bacterium]